MSPAALHEALVGRTGQGKLSCTMGRLGDGSLTFTVTCNVTMYINLPVGLHQALIRTISRGRLNV